MYKICGLFILVLVIYGCSSKKVEQTEQNVFTEDTFYIEGKSYFKEYAIDSAISVTETYYEKFEKVKTSDGKEILLKTNLRVSKNSSWYPQYYLTIKAHFTSKKKFDHLLWQRDDLKGEPVGLWRQFYKTVEHGCCDAEDGYTLYDLNNGKEILKFSEITTSPLNYDFIAYHSVSTVNFERSTDSTLVGKIQYINDRGQKKMTYSVHAELSAEDTDSNAAVEGPTEYTPVMSVESKQDLIDAGFFKTFTLYEKGNIMRELDTAKYYLNLKYYGQSSILIPLEENGINAEESISNSKGLSRVIVFKKN